jgi:hypothetical protein
MNIGHGPLYHGSKISDSLFHKVVGGLVGSAFSDELNRFFRTSDDAQSTRFALVAIGHVSSLPPMRATLQLRKKTERLEVGIVHPPHFEDIVGTNLHAIAFALAFRAIHDRLVLPWFSATFFTRAIGMFGCSARFDLVEAFVTHAQEITPSSMQKSKEL